MNATNVICNEIIEKITKLHEQISQSDLRLPDEITDLFTLDLSHHRFDHAVELLNEQFEASQGVHQLWNMGHELCRFNRHFQSLFWMLTFEHFANTFNVPLSWIASLRFAIDAEKRSWILNKMQDYDSPNGCNESIWAAHLDGVEMRLIENPTFSLIRAVDMETNLEGF